MSNATATAPTDPTNLNSNANSSPEQPNSSNEEAVKGESRLERTQVENFDKSVEKSGLEGMEHDHNHDEAEHSKGEDGHIGDGQDRDESRKQSSTDKGEPSGQTSTDKAETQEDPAKPAEPAKPEANGDVTGNESEKQMQGTVDGTSAGVASNTKADEKSQKQAIDTYQSQQAKDKGKDGKQDKEPRGGYDPTPVPKQNYDGYTCKFIFHRATNLPLADINTLSSDPYLFAILETEVPRRHKVNEPPVWRSTTIRQTFVCFF